MNGVEGCSSSSTSLQGQNGNYRINMNGFTYMQMEELKLQTQIYNYIAAGLPVPSNLIHPIWKSVFASFNGINKGTGHDPSLYNYNSSMTTEPQRCRRTDGKKWRCNKEVHPPHKYCQRHLQRGRSKKNVEANTIAVTTHIQD